MKIKSVIVDDDIYCRKLLQNLISRYIPQIEVVGSASNIEEAKKVILETQPTVLFLDIELNGESGFDLLAHFQEPTFKIIFTTSHHEYAIKAIKASCLDFILKPIDHIELLNAVQKLDLKTLYNTRINALRLNVNYENSIKRIIINNKNEVHFININEIICLKGEGKYTTFYNQSGEKFVSSQNIGEYDKILNSDVFFRSHKSWIINMLFVKRLDKENYLISLPNNLNAELSSAKKEEFTQRMQSISK